MKAQTGNSDRALLGSLWQDGEQGQAGENAKALPIPPDHARKAADNIAVFFLQQNITGPLQIVPPLL